MPHRLWHATSHGEAAQPRMFGLVLGTATTSTTSKGPENSTTNPSRRNTQHPPDERRADTSDRVTASMGIARTWWTLDHCLSSPSASVCPERGEVLV